MDSIISFTGVRNINKHQNVGSVKKYNISINEDIEDEATKNSPNLLFHFHCNNASIYVCDGRSSTDSIKFFELVTLRFVDKVLYSVFQYTVWMTLLGSSPKSAIMFMTSTLQTEYMSSLLKSVAEPNIWCNYQNMYCRTKHLMLRRKILRDTSAKTLRRRPFVGRNVVRPTTSSTSTLDSARCQFHQL